MDQQNDIDAALMQADVERITKQGNAELAQADGIRMASDKYNEKRDLANQMLGQSQAFMAIRKISDVSALLKLRFVKEHKLYREIKTADGQQFTWAMYCDALGVSHKTADEQILNLDVVGSDALESLQHMGISTRDLRKLRKLPEEDRQIIIESEAIDTGDKDAVRDLLEDIVTKHAKEKEVAGQREQTLRQTIDASNNVSEEKNRHIKALAEEIEQLKGNIIEGEVSPLVREIESERAQILIPLVRLKNRALVMEGKLNDSGKVDRAEYFALQAALDTLRDQMAQAMDAIYNAGAPFQASIASASLAPEDHSAGIN